MTTDKRRPEAPRFDDNPHGTALWVTMQAILLEAIEAPGGTEWVAAVRQKIDLILDALESSSRSDAQANAAKVREAVARLLHGIA